MTFRIGRRSLFSTTNIIMVFLVLNFVTLSLVFGYMYSFNQIGERYDADVNATATKLVTKADKNYIGLIRTTNELANNTNTTNTFLKFLTDNFGKDSGYLEREDFQYQQANDTYKFAKELLDLEKNRTR